jgi:hypothetical protein
MAWTIADGLGWLPRYSDPWHVRRTPQLVARIEPFAPVTIPVPAVPGALAFLPRMPDRVPHARIPVSRIALATTPVFTAAVAPVSWLPTYPGRSTLGVPPSHRIAAWPSVFAPPPGELIAIAQRLAWSPRYPGRVPHTPPPNTGGEFSAISPTVAAAGERCVDLLDLDLTTPAILVEQVATTGIVIESVTSPTILQEDLC